jgi:hypothetical protein
MSDGNGSSAEENEEELEGTSVAIVESLAEKKTRWKYGIAIYKDGTNCIMPVPIKWFIHYPEGFPNDPYHKRNTWCWFPVDVQNPKDYVDRIPEVTESVLQKMPFFQQCPVKRVPHEQECAMGKFHYIASLYSTYQLPYFSQVVTQVLKIPVQAPIIQCQRH